jgi:sarcosine oxidase
MKSLTVAVAGLGIHGSAAAHELAARGCNVLGFDLFPPLHKNGSSHGRSRFIRLAYSEGAAYVEMLKIAYKLWHALELESGLPLLRQTGALIFGEPGGSLVSGALASARQFDLPHKHMTAAEANSEFPGFQLNGDMDAFFEDVAGILDADRCVEAYQEMAKRLGAELHFGEEVLSYKDDGQGLLLRTDKNDYHVDRLVITSGPWMQELVPELNLPLNVVRQVVTHFQPEKPELFAAAHFPIYYFEAPEGCYYGFPYIAGQGVKFGRHDGGDICNARSIKRTIEPAEIEERKIILQKYLPAAAGPLLDSYTCMYTNATDRDFIVGLHPSHPNVVVGSWCGGHGFKFGPVSAVVHADLAMHGKTDLPVAFLSLERFRAQTI